MHVLFLTLYPDTAASPRYRVTQFLPYLREAGIECTVAPPMPAESWRRLSGPERQGRALWYHLRETPARITQLLGARRYDVVFVQKALMSAYVRGLPGLLRLAARRVIYDIDDAVHLSPAAPPAPSMVPVRGSRDQIFKIMRQADRVLAGNRWLMEEAQRAGARAAEFPTVADTRPLHPAVHPAFGLPHRMDGFAKHRARLGRRTRRVDRLPQCRVSPDRGRTRAAAQRVLANRAMVLRQRSRGDTGLLRGNPAPE